MEFLVKPYPHQMDILHKSRDWSCAALLWEMGTGKTGAIINIIRDKFIINEGVLKTLIISPQVTLYNWKEEFKKFSNIPSEKVIIMNGTGKKRIANLMKATQGITEKYDQKNIIIINWEALINEDIFDVLNNWIPDIIVGDEMHLIKNYKAKRSKQAVKLADRCRDYNGYVYGLTGTAILNSIEDIYMQYRFLDGGNLFGRNYFKFRNEFLIDVNASWGSRPGHFPNFKPRTEKFEELHQKIYSIATRVTKKEAMPFLPPLIKKQRFVELGIEQRRMYKEMKEDFITLIKDETAKGKTRAAVATLAMGKANKLIQITSGFIIDEYDNIYEMEKNPRLDETAKILEELVPNNKVIIWCSFIHNYKMLGNLCDKLKISHVHIIGGMSPKDKQNSIERFQNDDRVRVIIANRRAGGIGVNLTAAAYSIVFSRNFSLGEEKQSEARNHRGGSEIHEKIIKIDLVAAQTIDELVLNSLENKQNIANLIIDWSEDDL